MIIKPKGQVDDRAGRRRGVESQSQSYITRKPKALVYGKNDPLRSWPISANELVEVSMGSETNVKSPTTALHSICAWLRTNSPAKPPNTGSVFSIFSFSSTPFQSTLNDTVPGVGGGLSKNSAFGIFP